MTRQEIVQALRCCAKGLGHDDACENCKVGEIQNRGEYIEFAAANAIERLTDENAALRKKVPLTEDTMINLAAQALGVEADRLRELAEADKDGRCVVLPCKVGQRVFALLDTDKHISECEVKQIGMGNEIGFIGLEPIGARGREYGVALNGFGKTVFLTREAAEKALEGIKDGY